MSLFEMLNKIENLTIDAEIIVFFNDGEFMTCKYKGYTSAENNEPKVEQIDVKTKDGVWYGLEASEIKEIKKV